MQSTWEEPHSAALREYLDKGMSFSEIARALNQRFGTAYEEYRRKVPAFIPGF